MKNQELLPSQCPWCGLLPTVTEELATCNNIKVPVVIIACENVNCFVQPKKAFMGGQDNALKVWNKRSTTPIANRTAPEQCPTCNGTGKFIQYKSINDLTEVEVDCYCGAKAPEQLDTKECNHDWKPVFSPVSSAPIRYDCSKCSESHVGSTAPIDASKPSKAQDSNEDFKCKECG